MRIRLRAGSTSFRTGKPVVKLEVKTSHEGYASASGNKGIPGESKGEAASRVLLVGLGYFPSLLLIDSLKIGSVVFPKQAEVF